MIDEGVVSCNESALTGEAEDLPKSRERDCFLLSSCLLTEAEDKIRAVVIGKSHMSSLHHVSQVLECTLSGERSKLTSSVRVLILRSKIN